MIWRTIDTLPPRRGFYFCWHERWGRVVLGYNNGWGKEVPTHWLEADGFPNDGTSGGAEILTRG